MIVICITQQSQPATSACHQAHTTPEMSKKHAHVCFNTLKNTTPVIITDIPVLKSSTKSIVIQS